MTGRPKGYVRYFGISRIALRDMALEWKNTGFKESKLVE